MNLEYRKYLQSEDWKKKRRKKLSSKNRKRRRCAICASRDNLHIHHLLYRENLEDAQQSDLRILCDRCHKLTHELHKAGKFSLAGRTHNGRFTVIKAAVKKHLGLTGQNMFRSGIDALTSSQNPVSGGAAESDSYAPGGC